MKVVKNGNYFAVKNASIFNFNTMTLQFQTKFLIRFSN